jgi:predicted nucleic acid-binding protein
MATYLLDTNTIQCILKKREEARTIRIEQKLRTVLEKNAVVLMSPVVFYELARLLHKKKAEKQLAFLEKLAELFSWRDFNKGTWEIGAKLWATCRKTGKPTGESLDVDALIAAQAKEHNAVVVTDNIRHFQYLEVNYESW